MLVRAMSAHSVSVTPIGTAAPVHAAVSPVTVGVWNKASMTMTHPTRASARMRPAAQARNGRDTSGRITLISKNPTTPP